MLSVRRCPVDSAMIVSVYPSEPRRDSLPLTGNVIAPTFSVPDTFASYANPGSVSAASAAAAETRVADGDGAPDAEASAVDGAEEVDAAGDVAGEPQAATT